MKAPCPFPLSATIVLYGLAAIKPTPLVAASPFKDQELHGTITLTKPLVISAGRLDIADGTLIVTHGHPVTITVAGDLTIRGTATITGFEPALYDAKPAKVANGADGSTGISYDPGPGTDGKAPAEGGNAGGDGGEGGKGTAGTNGFSAGPMIITVVGKAFGELQIINDGTPGGDGGDGGKGGQGGNGQQGGRGVPNEVGFGIVLGAAKGPGGGGKAGNGGSGGRGGDGGTGGNGGSISIGVAGDISGFRLTKCTYKPGNSGEGGKSGVGGDPGTPGFGGRGAAGVSGRENERKGPAGEKGASGTKGTTGTVGTPGSIDFGDQPFFQDHSH